jgi:hypothetical protein
VEVLPNSGHFPHRDHPERFVKTLNDFVRRHSSASFQPDRWQTLLRNGPTEPENTAVAGEEPVAPVTAIRQRAAR